MGPKKITTELYPPFKRRLTVRSDDPGDLQEERSIKWRADQLQIGPGERILPERLSQAPV